MPLFLCIACVHQLFFIIPGPFRELSLEEAARRPLLTGNRLYQRVDPSELYPHVYDSLAKAKLTSAFIADSKVTNFYISDDYTINYIPVVNACISLINLYKH